MNSQTTARFWKCFEILPTDIQEKAKRSYRIWSQNPDHPSLHFKQIHKSDPIYSIRVGSRHRAIGIKESTIVIWFWIGTHEEYNNLVSQL